MTCVIPAVEKIKYIVFFILEIYFKKVDDADGYRAFLSP